MTDFTRGRTAIKYIFFEMLPSFLLGVFVFVFILLMFQALRLTEFLLVHGVKLETVAQIMGYLSISFLPVILPMSLLFAVLLTYGRLSSDSEIVSMKALGLNMKHLSFPALLLAFIVALGAAETSFYLAPWGNRRFEVLINELGRLKAGATIREGVFSEGFFDLVVYANQVDSKAGTLEKVFIYDERDSKSPLTIIAKEGQIINSEDNREGNKALLRLRDGNIHRTSGGTYTKIDFTSYDINLFDPVQFNQKKKSLPSFTIDEIKTDLKRTDLEPKRTNELKIEFHRRWALSAACFIFALLGIGLGTTTNKRAAKSNGLVLSIGLIVCYWILYVTAEGVAKNGHVPVWIAIWSVNAVFGVASLVTLRRTRT